VAVKNMASADGALKASARGKEKEIIAIEGDLILDRDTEFKSTISVRGSIIGRNGVRYDLKVNGDVLVNGSVIFVRDLSARNIRTPDSIDAYDVIATGHVIAADANVKTMTCGKGISLWTLTSGGSVKADSLTAIAVTVIGGLDSSLTADEIKADDVNVSGDINFRKMNANFVICEKFNMAEGGTLKAREVIFERSQREKKFITFSDKTKVK
jgi:hypothetical protein